MTGKAIILPARDEMLQRLRAVDDSEELQANFYPKLLDYAGSPKTAQSVGMVVMHAYFTYADRLSDMDAIHLHIQLPAFVDALVVDEETAKSAKEFLKKMLQTPE